MFIADEFFLLSFICTFVPSLLRPVASYSDPLRSGQASVLDF